MKKWEHDEAAHARAGGSYPAVNAAAEGCGYCDEINYADYEWACPDCKAELIAPWQRCPNGCDADKPFKGKEAE